MAFVLEVYLLAILVTGSQVVSSAEANNLTSLFELTLKDFGEQIVKKHLFIFFYEAR